MHIRRGEFVGIVGPSGSGKTSLLRAITGSLAAARGSVEVTRGTRIGYVPQVESVDWNFPIRKITIELFHLGHVTDPSNARYLD